MEMDRYKDRRGLYNLDAGQVADADYDVLRAIYMHCVSFGGWTVGTQSLISKEVPKRQRAMIQKLLQLQKTRKEKSK